MATAMIYDTPKLAEQLEHAAGFDAPRARAMPRILGENGGNLASREDILLAKGELKGETQQLGGELRREIHGLKAEIQDVRGDIRVLCWMGGTTLAGIAALLSIAITVALHVAHLG